MCTGVYIHEFTSLLCLSKGEEEASLAALWLHQVGHLHWIPSGLQKYLSTCWPALVFCQSGRDAGHDYKEKTKQRKREGSPVNHKCPVQVGPVLTCCHGDTNVRGEGGEWPSGVCLSVYVCTFVYVSEGINRPLDFSSSCYHKQHENIINKWMRCCEN